MEFSKYSKSVLDELQFTMGKLDDEECAEAVKLINGANKIFVLALGRVGFMIRAFAMRMMHMGKEAYVVGETITPNCEAGDLLIVGTASGSTQQLNNIAEKAKGFGANVLALTGTKDSPVTKIADVSVIIQAPSKNQTTSDFKSAQPMASLFEQSVLLLCDSLVLALMDQTEKAGTEMFVKHANLE